MTRRRRRRRRSGLGIVFTIPKSTYRKARGKVARSRRYWDKYAAGQKGGLVTQAFEFQGRKYTPGGRSLDVKKHVRDPATNRDRAVVEVYEFKNRKKAAPFMGYLKDRKITNFEGLRLCTVTSRKEGRRGFHDSKIVSVRARCIDGRDYVGTSPGDMMYARMRPARGR